MNWTSLSKRFLALILCFVMLVGTLPIGALASEAETTAPSETETVAQPAEAAADADGAAEIEGETPAEEVTPEEEAAPEEDAAPEEEAAPEEDAAPEEEAAPEEDVIPEEEAEEEKIPEEAVIVDEEQTAYEESVNAAENEIVIAPKYVTTPGVTLYKRVSSPESGKEYLIVNSNVAYGLNATGNTYGYAVAAADASEYFTVWTGDVSTSTAIPSGNYLTTSGAYLWTATQGTDGSWTFTHDGSYLGATSSDNGCGGTNYSLAIGTDVSNTAWTYSDGTLQNAGFTDEAKYLRYSNGWGLDNSQTVYFYEKVEETATHAVPKENSGGTYTIEAGNLRLPASNGAALLSSNAAWSGPEDEKTSSWDSITFAFVSGDAIFAEGALPGNSTDGDLSAALNHTVGTATVGVTYTLGDQSAYAEFTVETYAATPDIEIVYVGTTESIEEVITIKGDEMKEDYPLAYYLFSEEHGDQMDADGVIAWTSSNEGIATVTEDPENPGQWLVHFEGGEGLVQIAVSYTYTVGDDKFTIDDIIDISVSKSSYIVPSDGTEDFPEYPAEGAVRINKTASGVGAFSQTGVAQVELSMTGVPYSTQNPIDVVIMVDMSGSMKSSNNDQRVDRVTPAKNATIAALNALVKNEAGEFNQNRVAIHTFSAGSRNGTPTNPATDAIDPNGNTGCDLQLWNEDTLNAWTGTSGYINSWSANNGTGYFEALSTCASILETARAEENYNREQFVIFVTDGAPSTNWYYVQEDGTQGSLGDVGSGDEDDVSRNNVDDYTEWYSHQMKAAGVEIYTIGIHMNQTDNPTGMSILKQIAGTEAENAETGEMEVVDATVEGFEEYAQFVETDISELTSLFLGIVGKILEAATDVTVHDVVAEDYKLILDIPSGVELPEGTELKIEVVEYVLDENKNRVGEGTVIESVSAADTTKVTTDTDGNVTAINANNFTYTAEGQTLQWKADKLSNTELAIRYYVYLEGAADNSVEAGTYPTNEYAYITYTNYLGNECQKYFPVPQLTWQGAQVTYKFYLVNEDGQPVNRAGRVIPFTEAVYVTEDVTKSVTWNDEEGVQDMRADLLAKDVLPDVYELYDPDAYYEVRVYQTEGVDGETKNYNYFAIKGSKLVDSELDSDTTADNTTTKVYNTTAGVKYDKVGVYSAQDVGTVLNTIDVSTNEAKTVTTTVKATDIDYAATTVAFAVKWTKTLAPDTVILDYGLDVTINVATNDALDCTISGVSTTRPSGVTMNSGLYDDHAAFMAESTEIKIDTKTVATASLEPGSTKNIRVSLNKDNGMQFNKPISFYYESGINYYEGNTLTTKYLFSQVTVIPATTVYYEDEYVDLWYHQSQVDGTYTKQTGWTTNSTAASGVQGVDRPGENLGFGPDYDANKEYGNDAAYNESSTYSMKNAAMVTVTGEDYATAEFKFFGTGFDVISLTDSSTGVITVQVKDKNGEVVMLNNPEKPDAAPARALSVDTYYGYTYGVYQTTYYCDGYAWFLKDAVKVDDSTALVDKPANPSGYAKDLAGTTTTAVEWMWQPDPDATGTLYQIPVIKVRDLAQDTYTAIITVAYNKWLDHKDPADNGSYNFYLDAIRVYDPMKTDETVGGTTAGDIYVEEGEGYPKYTELRDILIGKADYQQATDGAVFIDDTSNADGTKTYTVEDYTNFGPKNEVYLAQGQALAFELDLTPYNGKVADVQIGMKSANGTAVLATLGVGTDTTTAEINPGESSTDRYYSIGDYVNKTGKTTLSIQNTSTASGTLLSLTTIKLTFTENTTMTSGTFNVNSRSVNLVLSMLNGKAAAEEEAAALPDAELEVSLNKTSVKEGGSVTVKVTTSDVVESLTVNGEEVTEYKQNKKTGKRTWTIKVKAEEAGELEIAVTAFDADGAALATDSQTVEVAAKKPGKGNQVVDQLLDKLFG